MKLGIEFQEHIISPLWLAINAFKEGVFCGYFFAQPCGATDLVDWAAAL
jgi:hypothetical protein